MTTHNVFGVALRRKTNIITLIAASMASPGTYADTSLTPVTVTANRIATESIAASTTVITREDIERMQVNNLPELLSRQQGIGIVSQGGLGKLSSLFMRGTESDHVLVLVDGVRWQSATAGGAALQHFPVTQIERIEIVRGPRSGLYGAEAMGGVIQIFTRREDTGFQPTAGLGFGSDNTRQASAGINGGSENTHYNISLAHQETEGINALLNNNLDEDGYKNQSVAANLSHAFSDRFKVGLSALYAEGENEYDGFEFDPTNFSDYEDDTVQQILSANASFAVTSNWLMDFKLGDSRDKSDNFQNDLKTSTFNTQHQFASLQNTVSILDKHTLIRGLDYDEDKVTSSTEFTDTSRDNKAVFASWLGDFDRLNIGLSGRYDDNEQFGSHTTGSAEVGFQINNLIRLVGSMGTGFKAPTFNDLYFPAAFGFQGNPDLDPERLRAHEIGLEGETNWGRWSARYFHNDIDDLITIKSDFSTVENIAESRIRGFELAANAIIYQWDVAANISILDPKNQDSDALLARRARQMANLSLDRSWGNLSAGASWKLQGHSYNDAANTQRLAGFGLVDLRAKYTFAPAWAVEARIQNLFDQDYFTALDFSGNGYQSLDRTGLISIVYQP